MQPVVELKQPLRLKLGEYMKKTDVVSGHVRGVLSGGRNARKCFTKLTGIALNDIGQATNSTHIDKLKGMETLEILIPDHVILTTPSFLAALIKPWWDASKK